MDSTSSPQVDFDNLGLNYVDSIKESDKERSAEDRQWLEEKLDQMIAILTSSMAKMRWQMQDTERQIEKEKNRPFDIILNKEEFLKFGEAFKEFYRIYIRVQFFLVDVYTAYKYMLLAKSDWDYRFFARRIYTLMYETNFAQKDSLLANVNTPMKNTRSWGDEAAFNEVAKCRKALVDFLEKNKTTIQQVRLWNEAHKSADTDKQFAAIEQLSVKESKALIDEYLGLLWNYYSSLLPYHKSLDEYNKRARQVMLGPGTFIGSFWG